LGEGIWVFKELLVHSEKIGGHIEREKPKKLREKKNRLERRGPKGFLQQEQYKGVPFARLGKKKKK